MACPLCDDTGWKPVGRSDGVRGASCAATAGARTSAASVSPTPTSRSATSTARSRTSRAYNESLQKARRRGAPRRRCVSRRRPRGCCSKGRPGVGKTHLAVAVLKQVIQTTGARGLFYDTRDLLRVIRSTYNPSIRTTELDILRPVMDADLLVLDDLGAEKTSEWVEETMNLIVNTRYNEKRLTIFTSNYVDIPDDSEPNSLLFRIGFRMRSRLHEMCEFLEIDGADYRELPANGGVDDLVDALEDAEEDAAGTAVSARQPGRLRAQLRDGKGDLKWSGGRAGS